MKKPRVRKATIRDKGLFRKLWKEYMEDQEKKGSLFKNNKHNLDVFTNIFEMYVTGEKEGVVLFIGQEVVSMWGDTLSPFEYSDGKTATGWGTYVRRSHRGRGLNTVVYIEAIKLMDEFGFETLLGSVVSGDEEGGRALKNYNLTERAVVTTSPVKSARKEKE